ncbi:ESX-1 secretion-associated protein [Mycolicibacterium thermoresistibile]|uniref:Extracellular matrix binding protein n=1 Tax=Mycolicibacterium thermoresistibile TaxID=1797 RepID=A0A117IMF4_MYCTH|nr:ESX-1 secretion-associated protein [Mycolicibacterium thermoresistibile]MCV7189461.1 ESX-1 secretion-associated protein [Mycolicibacterium thermoresistibile]GAT15129.1 extracellular matrix binding protein [Mycolicibacterium thermoresistibile]SNW16322.1 ESX-1 secretion-associated EspF-like protein [Mycolicibacterium thermoresistibile]
MGGNLEVAASDLTGLAGGQRDVATTLGSAEAATDGVTGKVLQTHGIVCAPTIAALGAAQMSRSNAAKAMERISNDLAEKLDTAAAEYTRTDQQGQQTLDGEMRPG